MKVRVICYNEGNQPVVNKVIDVSREDSSNTLYNALICDLFRHDIHMIRINKVLHTRVYGTP